MAQTLELNNISRNLRYTLTHKDVNEIKEEAKSERFAYTSESENSSANHSDEESNNIKLSSCEQIKLVTINSSVDISSYKEDPSARKVYDEIVK